MRETWKPIPDEFYGQYFEISDLGRVRSVGRMVTRGGSKNKYTYYKSPAIISQRSAKDPYLFVSLAVKEDGTESRKTFYIHKALAEVFIPRPSDKHVYVTHKDSNTFNNSLSNLEWITASQCAKMKLEKHPENSLLLKSHNTKSGYYKKLRSPARSKWKKIVFLKKIGMSGPEIAKAMGCSSGTIYNILKSKMSSQDI